MFPPLLRPQQEQRVRPARPAAEQPSGPVRLPVPALRGLPLALPQVQVRKVRGRVQAEQEVAVRDRRAGRGRREHQVRRGNLDFFSIKEHFAFSHLRNIFISILKMSLQEEPLPGDTSGKGHPGQDVTLARLPVGEAGADARLKKSIHSFAQIHLGCSNSVGKER